MNIVEMVVLVLGVGYVVVIFGKSIHNKLVKDGVVFGYLILLLSYLLIAEFRWQLSFLYGMVLILDVFYIIKRVKGEKVRGMTKKVLFPLSIILLGSTYFTVFAFPIYEIPTPSGDYFIGTRLYVVENMEREELYSDYEYRRFQIQVWYPSNDVDGYEVAPWLEGGLELSRALAKDNYLPSFALDHTTSIESNSYYDAPINDAVSKYPVVIVSHGWRGFKTLHTDYIEELASNGYVVISIDHTYGSVATVFGDDDVEYLNLDALIYRDDNPDFLIDANNLVNTYSGDIVDTIDYLDMLNTDENSIYYGKLDLDRIGLLGHSTGGGAGVNTALIDDRVHSVLGLDAWVEPIDFNVVTNKLDVPSLFIRSGAWETGENNENLYEIVNQSNQSSMLYQIDGTTHYDFAMVYMYSPLTKYLGLTGSVDSEELNEMLKDTILDFFNSTLLSESSEFNITEYEEMRTIEVPSTD